MEINKREVEIFNGNWFEKFHPIYKFKLAFLCHDMNTCWIRKKFA